MRLTTSHFVPGPTTCPHCGAERPPITAPITVRGREERIFAGWTPCTCEGAQAERDAWEAEQERAARGAAEAARLAKLDASGIPERYRCAAHPWAQSLAERIAGGQGFYLFGPNGTGKTTLACAAARICLDRGMSVRFAVSTSLLESLREFGKEARSLADDLAGCDLLVIDDLGKEGAGTPRAAERLFDLVNERYNRSTLLHPRPTLVTSNFRRGELPRMISEGGSGLAIASRLSETTEAVEMGGPDRRLS